MVQSASHSHRLDRNSWLAWILCGIVCVVALIDIVLIIRGQHANVSLLKLIGDTG